MTQRTSGVKKVAIQVSSALAAVGVAAIMLSLPMMVSAQTAGSGLGGDVRSSLDQTGTGIGLQKADLPVLVGKIIKSALGLLGMVLVVLIIYAGFLWMTAQGNEDQVTKAKDILRNAVIGMVIIFAAYAITSFVVTAIVGSGAPATAPAQPPPTI